MYKVLLTKLQIDFILKFCEGAKNSPGIRFSKDPVKRALLSQIEELEDVLKNSVSSGEIFE